MGYRITAAPGMLQRRARMLARIREHFASTGALEVDTPALSPAAPTDPAIESIAAAVASLGAEQYLHTSPEFAMKRLLAAGTGDIWQLCRVFRDGEVGRWHQPEFTMLEWYRVGWDDERLMGDVEALVRHAAGEPLAGWPAARVSYGAAFEDAVGVDPHAASIDASAAATLAARLSQLGVDVPADVHGSALLDLAFGTVVQGSLRRDALTFVHDYPIGQAALARAKGGTPPVAARFELFAGGLELANGFAELTDPVEQRRRFEADQATRRAAGLPLRPIDEPFLAALEQGLPDCAGVALGFDRLVAVAAGASCLEDVLPFTHERDQGSSA